MSLISNPINCNPNPNPNPNLCRAVEHRKERHGWIFRRQIVRNNIFDPNRALDYETMWRHIRISSQHQRYWGFPRLLLRQQATTFHSTKTFESFARRGGRAQTGSVQSISRSKPLDSFLVSRPRSDTLDTFKKNSRCIHVTTLTKTRCSRSNCLPIFP